MKNRYLRLIILFFTFFNSYAQAKVILKIPSLSQIGYSDEYHLGLLNLALSKTGVEYEIQQVEQDASHERLARELIKGEEYNIFWLGSSLKNSQNLIEIPIPLYRGLLGHRIFIIHKEDREKFKNITTLEQLLPLKGVVGTGWPDQDIMENSKLSLVTSTYKNAFKLMNAGKRADYFPRGSYEIIPELEKRKSLSNLVMEENLALVYRYAVLFYVSPKAPEVAKLVHQGLLKAYDDGSFSKYFKSSPLVQEVLNKVKIQKRKRFIIPNPYLSKEVLKSADRFWEFPVSENGQNPAMKASLPMHQLAGY